VYQIVKATGNAEWNNQWKDYSVEVELDEIASKDLYLYLQKEQYRLPRIEGISAFGGLSTPLRWGEVVPLYFALHQLALIQTNCSHLQHVAIKSRPKVVIMAQPKFGFTPPGNSSYRQEQWSLLMEFGRAIRSWCDSSSYRVVIIISGDQSHTHPWSPELPSIYQPDPSAFSIFPQSGNEHSEPFDQAINDWITGKRTTNIKEKLYRLDATLLMEEAIKREQFARSCGYTGSLTMQGIMENETIENIESNSSESVCSSANWFLTDFIFCHPTYYGMMAALYVKNQNVQTV